ncbi:MAG: hypothetical protein QW161_01845 [Candidatus Bathyarchaeia archaeon]
MNVQKDVKAVSTLLIIILMIISAIIGGIVSYAFTIAYYIKKPPGTALTITDVYINKEDVSQFIITVLNPSYSPTEATISRIAISLEGETQLYDVIGTEPSLGDGIVVPIGESKDITCKTIKKDNTNVTLGELIGSHGFAGKNIIVHVFSPDSAAANLKTKVPYVKLDMAEKFDSKLSFKMFNITIANSNQSEVDITIRDIMIAGVNVTHVEPDIRGRVIPKGGEPVCFMFNGSWHGLIKTSITVYTEQGYVFRKEIEPKNVYAAIQNVNFNVEHRDHFNVTIFNFAESANYVNVTKIKCRLDNGTNLPDQPYNNIGIMPNSTVTLKFYWNWTEYRGRNITLIACFFQDFETTPFVATTPAPIIVKVLSETSVFNLKDTEHFNLTILNHASSIAAINITQIVVSETGIVLTGTKVNPALPYGLVEPGSAKSFNCTLDWAALLKDYRNLTLVLHTKAIINNTLKDYTFPFKFTLPVAEINITSVDCIEIGRVKYLNVTIKNMDYSLWNLTMSKIILTINVSTDLLTYEYVFPENQTTLYKGDGISLFCSFDWQRYLYKEITVTVIAKGVTLTCHYPQ